MTGLTSHMTGSHISDTAGDWGAETVHIVHIRYGEIHLGVRDTPRICGENKAEVDIKQKEKEWGRRGGILLL